MPKSAEDLLGFPALRPSLEDVRGVFDCGDRVLRDDILNPHREPQVTAADKARARDASVLMLFVDGPRPSLLVTERAAAIPFAGHQVFPGGLAEQTDADAKATMYREVEEEIGLSRRGFDLLGRLADYYTHSGYRIAPYVGLTPRPPELCLAAAEVAGVSYLPLHVLFDPAHYELRTRSHWPYRANFQWLYGGVRVTGPTISLIIALYGALARLSKAA
ncbi:MAG: NUDIX domain-containing protein [Gammaproteobacteria bacterium]|nr:NUDIX domain-containing protein [Gammaproteobacteria bacterium]